MKNELLERTNAETSATVNTKVGLASHPSTIEKHGETLCDSGGPGLVAYAAGRRALTALYEAESSMHEALDAMSVPTQVGLKGSVTKIEVPYARRAELKAGMGHAAQRAFRAHEVNSQAIEEAIGTLAGNVERALTDPKANLGSRIQTSSEIRHYVAALPAAERLGFLQKTINEGDVEVAHAVLAATCYVSGLDKVQHKLVRELAAAKFCGRDWNQLNAAQSIRETLEMAGSRFIGQIAKLTPKVKPNPGEAAMTRLHGGVA